LRLAAKGCNQRTWVKLQQSRISANVAPCKNVSRQAFAIILLNGING
jgi:hypothetical protein